MPTSILHNTPMGKYTFYRMSIRVKKKKLTECTYEQIYILWNEFMSK